MSFLYQLRVSKYCSTPLPTPSTNYPDLRPLPSLVFMEDILSQALGGEGGAGTWEHKDEGHSPGLGESPGHLWVGWGQTLCGI